MGKFELTYPLFILFIYFSCLTCLHLLYSFFEVMETFVMYIIEHLGEQAGQVDWLGDFLDFRG